MDRRHLDEERLANAVSEYVDLLNAGAAPALEQYLQKHADLAHTLRPLLKTASSLADAGAALVPTSNDTATFNTVQGKVAAAEDRRAQRWAVEAGTAKIKIDQRSDVLLLLLHAVGAVWGKTKLVKLSFLTGKETNASSLVSDYFQHFAYSYGPFDDAVYRDIEALAKLGLVDARPPTTTPPGERQVDAVYRLTPRGKKFAEALVRAQQSAPGLVQDLQAIAQKYGHMKLDELLRYVYEQYPEYTTESVIRDEVLGKPPGKKQ